MTSAASASIVPTAAEADAVFAALEAKLDILTKLPLLQHDPVARGLLADMGRNASMDEINSLLDQLDARIKQLLAGQNKRTPADAGRRERAPRTLLRL